MRNSSMAAGNDAQVRTLALILGVLFLLLGSAGFVPSFVHLPADVTPVQGYGYLFGVFPTNYFHDAIGILVGLWGIAASTSLSGSIVFCQLFGVIYAAQAILGLLPFTNTLFGTMPLFGNNVWFSALLAGVAFYFGYIKADKSILERSPAATLSNSL